ncbi:MAG: protein jag [Clostridiales bacterium]|nr:protein jag [Clostridiales bacterium]
MEEEKVFFGKTLEEAVNNALLELALPREDVEITVLEEGKKKLFGSAKWKIRASEKKSDGVRAAQFIDGLLKIFGATSESIVVSEEESIKIEIKTESSSRVIGKRGDVLDAIQTLAGAVANIGREQYIKVVVDCENYRSQREETLVALAKKIEQKAIETGRKIILEPMNPYERRIIHAALVNSEQVKTASEGREPSRYIVVIPNDAKPGDRGIRYGEKRDHRHERGDKHSDKHSRHSNGKGRNRGDRHDGSQSRGKPSGGAKRGKKEIIFGTFLGNSGATATPEEDKTEE